MNRVIVVLLAIQLLIACVGAVLVQDAFVKDWINTNYGLLTKCSVLNFDTIWCLSNANRLYQINRLHQGVEHYIDLSQVGNDDAFVIAGSRLVTYTPGSLNVHIWEQESGAYLDEVVLGGQIESIERVVDDFAVQLADGTTTFLSWGPQGKILKKRGELAVTEHELVKSFVTSRSSEIPDHVAQDGAHLESKIARAGNSTYYFAIYPKGITVHNHTQASDDNGSETISSFLVHLPLNGKLVDIAVDKDSVIVLTEEDSKFSVEISKQGKGILRKSSVQRSKATPHRAILVDKPLSLLTIDKVHHLVEETHSKSVLYQWLIRLKTHLAQLGRFVTRVYVQKSLLNKLDETTEDRYQFLKGLITFDSERSEVIAKSSRVGGHLWSTPVELKGAFIDLVDAGSEVIVISTYSAVVLSVRHGDVIHTENFSQEVEGVYSLNAEISEDDEEELKELTIVALKFGDSLKPLVDTRRIAPSQYILEEGQNSIKSYKVVGNKLAQTWSYSPADENILSVVKNGDITSAIGIARHDRSVLYKYLNPNLVTVASKKGSILKITILDGITGAVLHVQEQKDEVIDFDSVSLLQTDNWVIYAYQQTFPTLEQRIVVLDLFSDAGNAVGGEKSVLEGEYNPVIDSVSSKSFLFPEKILALKSTSTKFGITIRSILALTESGSLIELPKYVLNSRRIDDRKMTQEDLEDDFRLMPYEPVVAMNTFGVLNHKRKLQLTQSQQILVRPTGLESTAVVCFVNELNEFCTTVQPSSSYDLLSENFDKVKLLITITVLFWVFVISKPLVYSKKLNAKWID